MDFNLERLINSSKPNLKAKLKIFLSTPTHTHSSYTFAVDIFGQYIADKVMAHGEITSAYGIDRITGMPVLVYTSDQLLTTHSLSHPHLALTLESGNVGELYYLVQELPMGFTAIKSLRGAALEQFYQQGLEVLKFLDTQGQPHGGITWGQVWWDGRDLLLTGAGLPWVALPSSAQDKIQFETMIQRIGDVLPAAPVPVAVPALRVGRAAQAPSAVETPSSGVYKSLSTPENTPENTPVNFPATLLLPPLPETETLVRVLPQQLSEFRKSAAPASEVALDETKPTPLEATPLENHWSEGMEYVKILGGPTPSPSSTTSSKTSSKTNKQPSAVGALEPETIGNIGTGAMRIGTTGSERDESWRRVQLPSNPQPAKTPWLNVLGVILGAALALGLILAAVAYFLNPPNNVSVTPIAPVTPLESCCSVTVTLEKSGKPFTGTAQVLVAGAPKDGTLKPGDVLGGVPGKIRFPAGSAEYTLLIQIPGEADQLVKLKVPDQDSLVVKFGN